MVQQAHTSQGDAGKVKTRQLHEGSAGSIQTTFERAIRSSQLLGYLPMHEPGLAVLNAGGCPRLGRGRTMWRAATTSLTYATNATSLGTGRAIAQGNLLMGRCARASPRPHFRSLMCAHKMISDTSIKCRCFWGMVIETHQSSLLRSRSEINMVV